MNAMHMIEAAMKKRTESGLKLTFNTHAEEIALGLPLSAEPFTCYPKDEAQKLAWIADGERKGWILL